MIINIIVKAFNNVGFREPIIFYLEYDLLVNLDVVVLIIRVRFESTVAFAYQILVLHIVSVYNFFLEGFNILFVFALVVCILMIHTIIEVLVVKLLILSITLSHSGIESNRHVLVYKHISNIFVDRFSSRPCLCVEWTQNY